MEKVFTAVKKRNDELDVTWAQAQPRTLWHETHPSLHLFHFFIHKQFGQDKQLWYTNGGVQKTSTGPVVLLSAVWHLLEWQL